MPAATDPTFEVAWLIGRIYPRSLESGQRDLFLIFSRSRINLSRRRHHSGVRQKSCQNYVVLLGASGTRVTD